VWHDLHICFNTCAWLQVLSPSLRSFFLTISLPLFFARPPLSERLEEAKKSTDRVYSIFLMVFLCVVWIYGGRRARRGGGGVLVIVCILTAFVQLTTTWRLERGGQSLGEATEEHALKLRKNIKRKSKFLFKYSYKMELEGLHDSHFTSLCAAPYLGLLTNCNGSIQSSFKKPTN